MFRSKHTISKVYKFTSDESDIPMKMRKAPSIAMRVEGELEIKINELHISKKYRLIGILCFSK
ncbi:hypothetical protein RSC2_00354 [Bacillus paralicheniformis]|nr:hypothetical protein RSC1_02921 [Bacillus paralicheniformis]BCE08558.1 hypothetical protein RSC2_00354 [Bacillus paralicheniformis]BCE14652.1 hypothetical protein RSC3_02008 [Bacillus paralicheniformis]GIN43765.1 hypothetical protein J23TS8_13320 [Bacillus paralicheniformis]GIN47815.1 hypothetical protein J25TS1_10690 [Bacillus paralicheniformis]